MNFEFNILYFIHSFQSPLLNIVMKFITKLGNGGMVWLILALAFFISKDKEKKQLALTIILSLCIELVLGSFILKPIIKRQRPSWIVNIPLLIKNPRDYSFPSGHTASSIAASFVIYKYKKSWGIISFILASLIAFSRLYLFVHFPTDVLGGIILGLVSAKFALLIKNKIEMKNKKLPSH